MQNELETLLERIPPSGRHLELFYIVSAMRNN